MATRPNLNTVDPIEPALPYDPSPEEQQTAAQIEDRFDRWCEDRHPHEGQWFVNAAYYRGRPLPSGLYSQTTVPQVSPVVESLVTQQWRRRVTINRLQAKVRARLAKFLRNRPMPVVTPATSEIQDKLNARATTKALNYAWRKLRLAERYHGVCLWALVSGHGYWWLHWDSQAMARVQLPDQESTLGSEGEAAFAEMAEVAAVEPPTAMEMAGAPGPPGEMGAPSPPSEMGETGELGELEPPEEAEAPDTLGTTDQPYMDVPLGDIKVEVGSPFEVLVADPAIPWIGDQPEIMRLTLRPILDIRARYPDKGKFVSATADEEEALYFERRIAALTSSGLSQSAPAVLSRSGTGAGGSEEHKRSTHVLVREWFVRPCAAHPEGRYVVEAGGVVLRDDPSLPYGFARMENPYPVIDFPDLLMPGQYWTTTVLEQLIGPQTLYDNLRSQLQQHLNLCLHPKVLVAKQHRLAPGAWNDQAGEMVEYWAHPSVNPPTPWVPPPISADTWRTLDLLREEMDTVAHIFPEAEGRVGQANSGFQTNLLQEATDAVHAPDVAVHERALEDAAYKIRALMKYGYTVPRLLSVAGRDMDAEVFEFSAKSIDDYADIRLETGSILPDLKGARIQSLMEMWNAGIFGPPEDPEARRQVQVMLEFGQRDDLYDFARRDEEKARRENLQFSEGKPVPPPLAFDHHDIHMRFHADDLKGAESQRWDPQEWQARLEHLILHARFKNPASAIDLATIYNRLDLVQDLLQQPPSPMGGAVGPPSGVGAPPSGTPPPGPAPGALPLAPPATGQFSPSPQGGAPIAPPGAPATLL